MTTGLTISEQSQEELLQTVLDGSNPDKFDIYDPESISGFATSVVKVNAIPDTMLNKYNKNTSGKKYVSEETLNEVLTIIKSGEVDSDQGGIMGMFNKLKHKVTRKTNYELISHNNNITAKVDELASILQNGSDTLIEDARNLAELSKFTERIYETDKLAIDNGEKLIDRMASEVDKLNELISVTEDSNEIQLIQQKINKVTANKHNLQSQISNLRAGESLVLQSNANIAVYQKLAFEMKEKTNSLINVAIPSWRNNMITEAAGASIERHTQMVAQVEKGINDSIIASSKRSYENSQLVSDMAKNPTIRVDTLKQSSDYIIKSAHELIKLGKEKDAAYDSTKADLERINNDFISQIQQINAESKLGSDGDIKDVTAKILEIESEAKKEE